MAPNRFHVANDPITYNNVGSNLGASVIIPKEISDLLLKRNTPRASNGLLTDTFLYNLIVEVGRLPTAAVNNLYAILKRS